MPTISNDQIDGTLAPPVGVPASEANEMNLAESAAVFDRFLRPPPVARDEMGRFTPKAPPENPGERPPAPKARDGEAPPADPRVKLPEDEQQQQSTENGTEDPAAPTEEEQYEIEADGEKFTVTASELAQMVVAQRKGATTQPSAQPTQTDEAAIKSRVEAALAAERQQLQAERAHYAQQLAQFVPQAITDLQTNFPEIKSMADLARLAVTDPARAVQFQTARDTILAAQQEQQRLMAAAQAQQHAEMEKYVKTQTEMLLKAEPIFADEQKGPAERKAVREFLNKQGFSDEELSFLTDHRTVLVARKAMLFDRMMAARPQDKRVAPVFRAVKPGAARAVPTPAAPAARADARRTAFKQLEGAKSVDALANVFSAMGIR